MKAEEEKPKVDPDQIPLKDPQAEKERLRKLEEDRDARLAADLFAGDELAAAKKAAAKPKVVTVDEFESLQLTSSADVDSLCAKCLDKLEASTLHKGGPQRFLTNLIKKLEDSFDMADLENLEKSLAQIVKDKKAKMHTLCKQYFRELPGAGAPQEEDDDVLVEALDHDLFEDTYQDDGEMDELYGRAPLQRRRLGRNGPRSDDHGPADGEPGEKTPSQSGSQHAGSGRDSPKSAKSTRSKTSVDEAGRHRPRGNLPPPPAFSGEVKKNPKAFRHWLQKVDSFVEIAKHIIGDEEIGLRLHSALEADAAEYLEDIPAKTFGVPGGWRVLIQVLREKFDERRMHKVGSAMKSFFKLQVDRSWTLTELVDHMDKSARLCREAGLAIPDEILVYQFFEHSGSSMERQANLLLRTSGDYDWKKMKTAIELLYPTTLVSQRRDGGGFKGYGGGKGRSAHEAQGVWEESNTSNDYIQPDMDIEDWLFYEDPVEKLADEVPDYLPENLARELHEVYATHRENRARLAKAVKARGFYVNKSKGGKKGSKGGGKSKDSGKAGKGSGGKSKGKGSGKARGMSLEQLKQVTSCADCGEMGHWRGDTQCKNPAKKAHETVNVDFEDTEQFEAYLQDYPPFPKLDYEEAKHVVKTVNAVKRKASEHAGSSGDVPPEQAGLTPATRPLDVFTATAQVKEQIESRKLKPVAHTATAPEAVREAFEILGVTPPPRSGSVWDCLSATEEEKTFDLDSMRISYMVSKMDPRSVLGVGRPPATVTPGRAYLTIDTACENTVGGLTALHLVAKVLEDKFKVKPTVHPEEESYRFGPGEPRISHERWHIVGSFNSKLCMDFVYVPDAEGNNYQFLHILEPNGSFNVFYPSATRNPGDVWDLFCLLWASWAGFPQTLWRDKDGAFEGEFLERIRSMGTLVDNPPAEAHWQAGQVEAYNRAFKDTAQKLVDEMVLRGDRDMRTLGCAVAAAMNDRIRSSGCSAYQWLFGKSPQIPEDVLSPDGKFEALQAMELDEELRRRNRIRAMADEKISAYRLNEAVRTAILRKSHPMKDDYEPGELVAFWREAKYRQGKKGQKGKRIPASWYRGVVVGPHKGDGTTKQNNFWVTSNGRCILVAKEQMRPAFGTELWPVHEHVLQELQDNPPQQYLDLRTDELPPVPEDDDEDLDQVPLFPDKKEEERMEEELGEGPPGEASSPAADAMDVLAEQEAAEAEDPTATASDTTTLPTHPSTRAPGTPVGQLWPQTPQKKMRTTPSHSAPSEAAPSAVTDLAMEQNPAVPEPSSAMVTNVGKDFWHADHKRGVLVRHHLQPRRALYDPGRAHDLPVRLDKLSRLRTTVMFLDSGRKMVRDTWVSPNSNTPMDKKWTGKTIFKILVRSAMEAQAEWQNPERMSRKDRKALEKELPWSAIPDEQKELYRQALVAMMMRTGLRKNGMPGTLNKRPRVPSGLDRQR
eukprot:g15271.t1